MKSIFSPILAAVLGLALTVLDQTLPTAEPRDVGMSAEGSSKTDPFIQHYITTTLNSDGYAITVGTFSLPSCVWLKPESVTVAYVGPVAALCVPIP